MKIDIKTLEASISLAEKEGGYDFSEKFDPIFVAVSEFAFVEYNTGVESLKKYIKRDLLFSNRLQYHIEELLLNKEEYIKEYIGLCISYIFSQIQSYKSLNIFKNNKEFILRLYLDLFQKDKGFKPELINDIDTIKSIKTN